MGGTGDVQSQGAADGTGRVHARWGLDGDDWTFFALALLSALNPKLFAFDLVLIENARPRLMFGSFLLGGMGIPFAFLGFRPEGPNARLQHAQD